MAQQSNGSSFHHGKRSPFQDITNKSAAGKILDLHDHTQLIFSSADW
jgi:hypothetical protein